jgi:hypothetical protein
MLDLLPHIKNHFFPTWEERLREYLKNVARWEPFFHWQLILLIEHLKSTGIIETYEYEYQLNPSKRRKGKKAVDFYIRKNNIDILCEVKAICMRPNVSLRELKRWVWQGEDGPGKDCRKLNSLPSVYESYAKWVLAFWYKAPSLDQWEYVKSDPSGKWELVKDDLDQYPDYGFISLWHPSNQQ